MSEICSFFIWIITSPMSTPTLSAIEPVPYPTHIGTKDDRYAFPTCFANIGDSRSELGAGDCLRLSDELFKSWLVKTQDCMPIKHGHVNIVLPGKSHGLFGGKRVGANIMVLVGYSFARKKLFQRLTMRSGRAGIRHQPSLLSPLAKRVGRSAYIIDILKSSFNRNMEREHAVLGSEVCMGSK